MRKLVALASLNDQGTRDEDVMDAMVALAQKHAQDQKGSPDASATDALESDDAVGNSSTVGEPTRIKIGSGIEPGHNIFDEPVGDLEMEEIESALAFASSVEAQRALLATMASIREEIGMDALPSGIILMDGTEYRA